MGEGDVERGADGCPGSRGLVVGWLTTQTFLHTLHLGHPAIHSSLFLQALFGPTLHPSLPLVPPSIHRGPTQGDIPGFHAAGELARALVASASAGTDPPLPVPLPHTKATARGAPAEAGIIPVWPPGCLGYLFNLVRPCTPGTRAALLHGLFGPALVFESLESAAAYRELVVRRLRGGVSDIVTLDCRRITGRGIVSGSGFNVPPLERAEWRFGSLGGGQVCWGVSEDSRTRLASCLEQAGQS